LNSENLKDLAIEALNDMKGQNLSCLDVAELSSFADFMIVVTGTSSRHVKSLADELSKKTKEAGLMPRVEGEEQGDWILLDLGDVIVHVMQAETRKLYDLESLWAMGNTRGAS
jgi:ribosome-associated protein